MYNYMTVVGIDKLLKFQEPQYLCEWLHLSSHESQRNNRIYLPYFRLTHYQNNFCYQAPRLWNLLGSNSKICKEITSAPTLNSMKSRLKKFLFEMMTT